VRISGQFITFHLGQIIKIAPSNATYILACVQYHVPYVISEDKVYKALRWHVDTKADQIIVSDGEETNFGADSVARVMPKKLLNGECEAPQFTVIEGGLQ